MDERSLRLLEFDKILDWVATRAVSEPGALALRCWRPFADEGGLQCESEWLIEALTRATEPGEWCWTGRRRLETLLDPEAIERLDGAGLVVVREWLAAARLTRDAWRARGEHYPAMAARWGALAVPEVLLARLERSLEDDGRVADQASKVLASLRREAEQAESKLKQQLERWSRPFGENCYLTRAGERWVVMVPAAGFPRRRGIVHDVSGSGQSLFVEPLEACEGNNQVMERKARAVEEERRILAELAGEVAAQAEALLALERALAHLDTLRARALWAREVGARAVPVERPGGELVLAGARHPLLLRGPSASEVVPLDLRLGGEQRVLLVSGPNMGGKTVLLKTVGLSAALAASAFPVPAAEGSRMPRFSTILVEMGDEQSVERGLSTFAAHLEALAGMADRAAPDALLLCDELGAGTDPEEGAALGQALLEHFAARGAWVVATTHLGPLKRVAGAVPGVVNGTLEFDERTLSSRYRFLPGVPGASYALAVAERRGFPAALLARARELTPEAARALERLLREVEEARGAASRAAARARAAEEEARRVESLLRVERLRAAAAEAQARGRLAERGDALLSRAQGLLHDLQRATREGEKSRARAADLKREAAALEAELAELRPAPPAGDPALEIVPGARVRVVDLNVEAEVVSPPDAEGRVVLQRGAWKIQSHRSRLARGGEAPAPSDLRAWQAGDAPASLEVDLRGMEADEALRALDQAVDRAVLAGLRELRVVHGVGRGVLRSAVGGHLKGHPQVDAYRLGGVGEGGRGVTLVELR